MARSANLNVVITGDTKGLERATKHAGGALDKLGKDTTLHARVTSKGFAGIGLAARGMAAGVTAGVAGVGFLVKQFEDSNKIAKQTDAVLKSTGGSANVTAKQVSALATAISRKTGIDDEAVQSSENMLLTFTNVRNEVGKGNNIFTRATKTVQDMSVALGQDGKSSAIQLGKALNDPIKGITALQRVGVSFTESQKKQIKGLVEHGHALQAQKIILHELNKEFGGSAAAQATPFDKLKVSAGNLAETLGGLLAPMLGKAAAFLTKFLDQIQSGKGAGGAFAAGISTGFRRAREIVQAVVSAIRGYLTRHRQDIHDVIEAFKRVASFAKTTWQETLLPIVKRTVAAIGPIVRGLADVIRGVVRVISGLLSGNWDKAWSGAKEAVSGAWRVIKAVVKTGIGDLWELIKDLGPKLVRLIVKGIANLGKALATGIADGVKAAAKAVPGLIGGALKGIGKTILDGMTGGLGGKIAGAIGHFIGDGVGKASAGAGFGITSALGAFPGALHGANAALSPIAKIAGGFGLGITAGRTDHNKYTTSGNLSYHGSGEALDFSNGVSTPQEMGFARYMVSHFGGRLAELIHTPLGFSIKDGKRVAPIDAKAHYNHVHVAMDLGRPGVGIGDGPGRPGRFSGDGLGFNAVARLAESVGLPGVTFAQIAHGESSYDPKAIGHDPGGTTGYGLWQITSGYNDDIIRKYGGPHALLSAHTNALAARDVWRRQGPAAWHGTRYVTGWNLHYGGAGAGAGSGSGASAVRLTPAAAARAQRASRSGGRQLIWRVADPRGSRS
jgi:hypothetical protein